MVVLLSVLATAAMVAARKPQVIPTVYEAGHFYAVPETVGGQKLRLLVDTGGGGGQVGLYWITASAAKRLHLGTGPCKLDSYTVTVAHLPDYKAGQGLPPPVDSPCGEVVRVQKVHGRGYDGQFSGSYLYAGGVWTFDYPSQRLTREGDSWRPNPSARATHLGFQRDEQGGATFGYARITIRVAGRSLDMLLDTGATAHPTAAGEKASGVSTVGGQGVTSYITTSMLDRWHKAHPQWRVVARGDDAFGPKQAVRIIEVPHVEIAGWDVGPVWFTERPDSAFHEMMASMMDKPVEGAVGANVFQHFVMTIDYPHATAWFRCVHGCKPASTPVP